MSSIKTDELDQWHEYGVYKSARLISLSGSIDEESKDQFIKNIRLLDFLESKDITVLMDTEGGSVDDGLTIYDAIKECHSDVTVHVIGSCWSMGAIILQAADKRKISQNGTLMIHEGTDTYPENHPKINDAWRAESKRKEDICIDILLEKMQTRDPKLTRNKLKKLVLFDKIYDAEKSVELGLVDEIIEHKGYTNE